MTMYCSYIYRKTNTSAFDLLATLDASLTQTTYADVAVSTDYCLALLWPPS